MYNKNLASQTRSAARAPPRRANAEVSYGSQNSKVCETLEFLAREFINKHRIRSASLTEYLVEGSLGFSGNLLGLTRSRRKPQQSLCTTSSLRKR